MADFRPLRWKPIQFLVYLGVRFLALLAAPFPLRSLARLVGAVLFRLDRKHRRVAERNLLRAAFSPSLVPLVFENAALIALETIRLPRLLRHEGLSRHVRFHRLEVFDALVRSGRGVIVAAGHLGNWEIAGIAVTVAGYRLHSLARPIENPYLNRWVLGTRTSTGQTILPKHGAVPAMAEVLRRGGVLVVQVDQDARRNGERVDFFGSPASTVRSPAVLSLKYGSPILPINVYRERGLHHICADEPIDPDAYRGRPDAVRRITQVFTSRLESFVRDHPEQWNWLHRRWKSVEKAEAKSTSR